MAETFISYSRRDSEFVHTLQAALQSAGRETWVDWEDIPPTAEWLAEIHAAIEAADTFLFVLSPDSIASHVCGLELAHAIEQHKRLVPVVRRDVNPADAPESLAKLNWIFFREDDDFAAALQTLLSSIDLDLAWAKTHTRLLTRALEWRRRNQDGSLLLRGGDLREAEDAIAITGAERTPQPTELQRAYVVASRRAARRTQRLVLVAVSAAAAVLAVLAVVAWLQRSEAIREQLVATSRELASYSGAQLHADPELSLLLAVQAAHTAPTSQAVDALRQALYESHLHTVLRGSTGKVVTAVFSPDGKTVATGGTDGMVRLWNADSGDLLQTLSADTFGITSVAFSPDGSMIAAVSPLKRAKVWDAHSGTLLAALGDVNQTGQAEKAVISVAFLPDNQRLITNSVLSPNGRRAAGLPGPGSAKIWDARSGQLLSTLDAPVTAQAAAPANCPQLGAGGNARPVQIWDVNTSRLLSQFLSRYYNFVGEMSFSGDGTLLATPDDDGYARIYDTGTGECQIELQGIRGAALKQAALSVHGDSLLAVSPDGVVHIWGTNQFQPDAVVLRPDVPVANAAFAPDGQTVATAGDKVAHIWAVTTGEIVTDLSGHGDTIESVAFSADGRQLLTANDDGTARVWDLEAVQTPRPLAGVAGSAQAQSGASSGARAVLVAFSPDSRLLAAARSDGRTQIWAVADGSLQRTLVSPPLNGVTQAIRDLAFSPDSRLLALATDDGHARLWSLDTSSVAADLAGHTGQVNKLAFSPDGRLLVTASADNTARIWDVASGKSRQVLQGHEGGVLDADFSPDGKRVLTAGDDKTARIWDVSDGRMLVKLQVVVGSITSAVFSPDGKRVLTASGDGVARLWDAQTGAQLQEYHGQTDGLSSVAFSPDGSRVVTAGGDHRVREYDTVSGRLIAELLGNTLPTGHAAFSPDGKWVVAAGGPGAARIWDADSAAEVEVLGGQSQGGLDAVFSPDGQWIGTADFNSGPGLYQCVVCSPLSRLLDLAGSRAKRGFTAEEGSRYLHR